VESWGEWDDGAQEFLIFELRFLIEKALAEGQRFLGIEA